MGRLSQARFIGHHDVQGFAMDALGSAVQDLPPKHSAPLLMQMLGQAPQWSDKRGTHEVVPHSRREIFETVFTERGMTVALVGITGNRSVRNRAYELIGKTLKESMTLDASVETAKAMLPVCHGVLRDADAPQELKDKALTALVRAALPGGLSHQERAEMLTLAFGAPDERDRRGKVLDLIDISRGRGLGGNPTTRLAAARALHHLLDAGDHGLGDTAVEKAREAVKSTFAKPPSRLMKLLPAGVGTGAARRLDALIPSSLDLIIDSVKGDSKRAANGIVMVARMVEELQGSDAGLASMLTKQLSKHIKALRPEGLVQQMPLIATLYGHLWAAEQKHLGDMLLSMVPEPEPEPTPTQQGNESQPAPPRQPGLPRLTNNLINELVHGTIEHADSLPHELWQGMISVAPQVGDAQLRAYSWPSASSIR